MNELLIVIVVHCETKCYIKWTIEWPGVQVKSLDGRKWWISKIFPDWFIIEVYTKHNTDIFYAKNW